MVYRQAVVKHACQTADQLYGERLIANGWLVVQAWAARTAAFPVEASGRDSPFAEYDGMGLLYAA